MFLKISYSFLSLSLPLRSKGSFLLPLLHQLLPPSFPLSVSTSSSPYFPLTMSISNPPSSPLLVFASSPPFLHQFPLPSPAFFFPRFPPANSSSPSYLSSFLSPLSTPLSMLPYHLLQPAHLLIFFHSPSPSSTPPSFLPSIHVYI